MKKVIVCLIVLAMSALFLTACQDASRAETPTAKSPNTNGNDVAPDNTDNEQKVTDKQPAPVDADDIGDSSEDPVTNAIPEGYVSNDLDKRVGHLQDNGEVSFAGDMQTAKISFCLPEKWVFDGGSVAYCDDKKVFEIGGVFPTEEFSTESVRIVDDTVTLPTSIKGEEGEDITIYEEIVSDQGLYDYRAHTETAFSSDQLYEVYRYIVSHNGYSVYVTFVVNEFYDEDVCQAVLSLIQIN